jgi:DNA polymerase (family 10)
MLLEQGKAIAAEVIELLSPFCHRIEIAGSIRRKKQFVNDIDVVLIPSDPWNLIALLDKKGHYLKNGPKIKRWLYRSAAIDFYFATRETWATLFLIRTGSKENNIRLCSLAQQKGWHLKADGEGLFDADGKRIAGDTEESIYETLGIPYQQPEDRG